MTSSQIKLPANKTKQKPSLQTQQNKTKQNLCFQDFRRRPQLRRIGAAQVYRPHSLEYRQQHATGNTKI